jgi:hypothetical protein
MNIGPNITSYFALSHEFLLTFYPLFVHIINLNLCCLKKYLLLEAHFQKLCYLIWRMDHKELLIHKLLSFDFNNLVY